MPSAAKVCIYALAIATLATAAVVLGPLWRLQPVCRFWALGAALSLLPMCATFPMDRLLVFAGVGSMAVIAMLLAAFAQREAPATPGSRGWTARDFVALSIALIHLVVAPVLLPIRTLAITFFAGMFERVDASIPRTELILGKTLVIVNAPVDGTVAYVPLQRAALGVPRPRRLRLLASGVAGVTVSRLDETRLRVRPADGFLKSESERMVRGLSTRSTLATRFPFRI